MNAQRAATLLLPALLLVGAASSWAEATETEGAVAVEGRWLGPEGRPLPFANDEEALEFLRRADVIGWKELTSGTNRPFKVFLERDGVRANAIFRTVDIRMKRARLDSGIIPDFHDSHIYECGAYEVARALGIDNVPPCVQRRVDLKPGTLQLWVEGAMMELERHESGKKPPEPLRWIRQKQTMRLFDALIFNFDRNQTNMLIDESWKLWFVDHTRSFRRLAKLDSLGKIIWCERQLWERLQALDKEQLSKAKRYISGPQLSSVLKRRDLLVDHIQSLIDSRGETVVLFDAGVIEMAEDLMEQAAGISDEYPEQSTPVTEDGRR